MLLVQYISDILRASIPEVISHELIIIHVDSHQTLCFLPFYLFNVSLSGHVDMLPQNMLKLAICQSRAIYGALELYCMSYLQDGGPWTETSHQQNRSY